MCFKQSLNRLRKSDDFLKLDREEKLETIVFTIGLIEDNVSYNMKSKKMIATIILDWFYTDSCNLLNSIECPKRLLGILRKQNDFLKLERTDQLKIVIFMLNLLSEMKNVSIKAEILLEELMQGDVDIQTPENPEGSSSKKKEGSLKNLEVRTEEEKKNLSKHQGVVTKGAVTKDVVTKGDVTKGADKKGLDKDEKTNKKRKLDEISPKKCFEHEKDGSSKHVTEDVVTKNVVTKDVVTKNVVTKGADTKGLDKLEKRNKRRKLDEMSPNKLWFHVSLNDYSIYEVENWFNKHKLSIRTLDYHFYSCTISVVVSNDSKLFLQWVWNILMGNREGFYMNDIDRDRFKKKPKVKIDRNHEHETYMAAREIGIY